MRTMVGVSRLQMKHRVFHDQRRWRLARSQLFWFCSSRATSRNLMNPNQAQAEFRCPKFPVILIKWNKSIRSPSRLVSDVGVLHDW
ncbi:hypothetical protein HanRHA438_Chr15g0692401 [Helianthus annuus]|nr:hypothetical protein HanRHA438_Chr15g0692401 [Helianthus annuus]KAJ0862773.1 hypothetical protein HanPSC8_Chr12g0522171 [Helianthus annuus]